MRILIYTPAFYPNTGGLETINMIICEQLNHNGFDVALITPQRNPRNDDDKFPYKVIRDTSYKSLWHWYKWCDVYVHSVLSLNGIWPLLIWPKTWVAIHHTCYFHAWDGKPTFISRLKKFASRFAKNATVSHAVAHDLGLHNATVIHNAFNSQLFINTNKAKRKDFIYVGRLVSEKGVNLLIEAYKIYAAKSSNHWGLTIIGDGPEKNKLQSQASDSNIHFLGKKCGEELVKELNNHACIIVPSIYHEAFGIVALEGLACGCQCIVSDGDGLQEAIGDCGILFKKGDAKDMAKKMLLVENSDTINYKSITKHLEHFTSLEIGHQYVNYFKSLR
jgi:glycogen(starch) synthase